MSLEAMTHVFKRSYGSASQKLMMLAIADRADDDGVCYAGLKHYQKKHNNISSRTAEKLIAKLEESGDLVVIVGNGIETGHGKTNRYYLKTFRDELGLPTPKPGSRAEQLEQYTDWQRPVKSDGGQEPEPRPVKSDGHDPSTITGHDPSKPTGNPLVYPSVDSIPLPNGNGGKPAVPDEPDDPDIAIETDQKRTHVFLGVYWSRLVKVVKETTGSPPLLIQGDWRQKNFNAFLQIAGFRFDDGSVITTGEFAAYLDFLLDSDWYKRNREMPAIERIGKKIVLHIKKKRDTVKQGNDSPSDNESNWSQFNQ